MSLEGTLDEYGTSLDGYEGSMSELPSDYCLQHDDRSFVTVEDVLELHEFMVEEDLHQILTVLDQS